jgi:hypothetical protein
VCFKNKVDFGVSCFFLLAGPASAVFATDGFLLLPVAGCFDFSESVSEAGVFFSFLDFLLTVVWVGFDFSESVSESGVFFSFLGFLFTVVIAVCFKVDFGVPCLFLLAGPASAVFATDVFFSWSFLGFLFTVVRPRVSFDFSGAAAAFEMVVRFSLIIFLLLDDPCALDLPVLVVCGTSVAGDGVIFSLRSPSNSFFFCLVCAPGRGNVADIEGGFDRVLGGDILASIF